MQAYELDRFRRRLEDGEGLDVDDQRRLVAEVAELTRLGRLAAEFIVRVHRDHKGTRWAAEHPLLPRSVIAADHPGDALVRAGLELRRVLERDFPGFTDGEADEHPGLRRQLTEDIWHALTRTDPGPDTVTALQGALEALREVRREADDLRYGESLRRIERELDETADEREAARAELRRRHAARLAGVGVEAADVSWRDDAFGPADEFCIDLPVLVVGFAVRTDWPSHPHEQHRLDGGRWVALEHHWRNEDLWSGDPKSVRLIAQPLQVTPDAELALRRVADAAPSGRSVADHGLVTEHLPGVSVDRVTGWVSPAALPLDPAGLDLLVADPPDLTRTMAWLSEEHVYWLSDRRGDCP